MNLFGIQKWFTTLRNKALMHSLTGNFLMTAAENSNKINRCIVNMSTNPCDATVSEYINTVKSITLKSATQTEYEKNIGRVWERVNMSPNVSTQMKEKLLDYLLYSGKVYIDNPMIIDNYGAGVES